MGDFVPDVGDFVQLTFFSDKRAGPPVWGRVLSKASGLYEVPFPLKLAEGVSESLLTSVVPLSHPLPDIPERLCLPCDGKLATARFGLIWLDTNASVPFCPKCERLVMLEDTSDYLCWACRVGI